MIKNQTVAHKAIYLQVKAMFRQQEQLNNPRIFSFIIKEFCLYIPLIFWNTTSNSTIYAQEEENTES